MNPLGKEIPVSSIPLYETEYDIQQALREANRVISSDKSSPIERLDAFCQAIRAEVSMGTNYLESFERQYHAAQTLRSLIAKGESEARTKATEAYRQTYLAVLENYYEQVPNEIKEEFQVTLDNRGNWDFLTEY